MPPSTESATEVPNRSRPTLPRILATFQPEPARWYAQTAPLPLSSLGPLTSMTRPSPDRRMSDPNSDAPTSSLTVSLLPSCFQLDPERTKIQTAPRPLPSIGPPTAIVDASPEIAMDLPISARYGIVV